MNTVIKEGEVATSSRRQQYPLPPSMSFLLSLGSIWLKIPHYTLQHRLQFVINCAALSNKKKANKILNNGLTLFWEWLILLININIVFQRHDDFIKHVTYENCFNLRQFFEDTCVTFSKNHPHFLMCFQLVEWKVRWTVITNLRLRLISSMSHSSLLKLEFVLKQGLLRWDS